jgi:putative DNA primase/helicase
VVPNDLAGLVNTRMVTSAEVEEGRQLNEARVKDITGGSQISARHLFGKWFQFLPVFKLWMFGNHRPNVVGTDDAIWNRVRMIPFDVTIAKAEQDPDLRAKLLAELPGILNWALRGCLDWQRNGLGVPLDVQEATKEYREDMDVLGRFIADRCEVDKANYDIKCRSTDLYTNYKSWCHINGEHSCSHRKFSQSLREKGYKSSKESIIYWHGIRIQVLDPSTITPEERNGHHKSSGDLDLARFDSL